MTTDDRVYLGLSGAVTGIIALLTIDTLQRFLRTLLNAKSRSAGKTLYEDEDGVATEDSQKAYSVLVSYCLVFVTTVAAFLGTLYCAVVSTTRGYNGDTKASQDLISLVTWLNFTNMAMISVQTTLVLIQRRPVDRSYSGIVAAVASLFALAGLVVEGAIPRYLDIVGVIDFYSMLIVQLAVTFILLLSFLSFPRRPNVYHEEKLVERERTVSPLGRLLYNWPAYLLDLAKSKGTIELTDLPILQFSKRSKNMSESLQKENPKLKLWQRIILNHSTAFAVSITLTFVKCVLQLAPRFAMLRLLQILERRSSVREAVDGEAWVWVITLFLVSILAINLDGIVVWVGINYIGLPLQMELTALVFEKAMRKKDSKEPPSAKQDSEETQADDKNSKDQSAGDKKDDQKKDDEKKEKIKKVEEKSSADQATINLISVDSRRLGMFGIFLQLSLSTIFACSLSIAFLWQLIGWQALLTGVALNLLSVPLNTVFAAKYWAAQKSLMSTRDKKLAVVSEALQGIRQIKFSALEKQWENRIGTIRKEELDHLWGTLFADLIQNIAMMFGPILMTAGSLAMYAYIYGELSASVAFTSLGIFRGLEQYIGWIPDLLTLMLDAFTSMTRIDEFFKTPDRVVNRSPGDSISFDNVTVTFPSNDGPEVVKERFRLRSLNLTFPNQELSVISGKTGAGKTLLLNAILGEVDVIEGTITVPETVPLGERFDSKANADSWIIPSAIAYVSQIPWIQNATIKNNIIFGLPFDEQRYKKVLDACALTRDLEILEDGDSTEVGAQGISLSGGQRWRLTFARALYSRAGILVMDDLFSALDAHVGRHIYENGLTGELAKGRTRILATHHIALCLPNTKYAVLLADGTAEKAGLVEELQKEGDIDLLLKVESDDDGAATPTKPEESLASSEETLVAANDKADTNAKDADLKDPPGQKATPKKLVEDETREKGAMKRDLYIGYLKASGGFLVWASIFFAFAGNEALAFGRRWIIKLWAEDDVKDSGTGFGASLFSHQTDPVMYMTRNRTASMLQADHSQRDALLYYLGLYLLVSFASVIVSSARLLVLYKASLLASRNVFNALISTLLRMPSRWVDTVPTGRILNRVTADMRIFDDLLCRHFGIAVDQIVTLIGVVVAASFVSPWIIVLAAVLAVVCTYVAARYLRAAREVKRLESVCKSFIFDHLGTSLAGLSTIRAWDNVKIFEDAMHEKIDQHCRVFWHQPLMNRWMGIRLSYSGAVFSAVVAAFIVMFAGIDAALAGFALTFSLELAGSIIAMLNFYSQLELDMNASERVVEYSNLKTESQEGAEVPASWPSEGRLDIKDLVLGYAEGLPDILKGVSFSVDARQRVGVVGRTGAGKSTITLALFRILEARSGSINIDYIDISKIKLQDLRSRLAIIPQDPVLFSGTVRSNLDPFEQAEDQDLRQALERVHLVRSSGDATPAMVEMESSTSSDATVTQTAAEADTNTNVFESLSSEISSGGLNLSQGQRQLLCLARAIVSRPKIMVLDEATSAVDHATDILIQRSIREEFTNTTLLVIAHRLSTVADFDKILVLDQGQVAEFGTPLELLNKEGGAFKGMVGDSGEKEMIEKMIREGVRAE
ncbi:hypothetical protein MMC25_004132 [Agyrium rufum]|nr:hypothetical protein [Agyrium rufum]